MIAAHPTNPDIVYVGAINGGIWKTTNATASSPTWTPLTDQLPSLSISDLAFSPVDLNTLYAGTGSFSSFSATGGFRVGVYKTTDGGDTWTVLNPGGIFSGLRIREVVPTSLDGGQVVLLAARHTTPGRDGVYRSADGGASWTRISGTGGLPTGGVSHLVADPDNPSHFYAAIPSSVGRIYRSDDGGLNWSAVGSTLPAVTRIELSVHNSPGNNVVYAAFMGGSLTNVFRSTNQGTTWTAMGVPANTIHPGGQADRHFSMVADPNNPNVVFVGGDRQTLPSPNGYSAFSGNFARGDASLLPGNPWAVFMASTTTSSSPHADSRDMVFDANGNILEADDGGLYRLINPNSTVGRVWVSFMGDIRVTEFHSTAYDNLTNTIHGGTQDTGTPEQVTAGNFTWRSVSQADGGIVAVDTTTNPGFTIRYSSFQNFGNFRRRTYNAANVFVSQTTIPLNITSGLGAGMTLFAFGGLQFVHPFELNKVAPTRLVTPGGSGANASIFESFNQGTSLANLGQTGGVAVTAMAYGGRLNGVNNPEVLYFSAGATIRRRFTVGGPITIMPNYPGSTVRDMAMDPENYRRLYVADSLGRVWASFNADAASPVWFNITGDLQLTPGFTNDLLTIEVFSPTPSTRDDIVIIGGVGGVFKSIRPGQGGTVPIWTELTGLPNGRVRDVRYDKTDDVLVAGIQGRGAWTLPGASFELLSPALAPSSSFSLSSSFALDSGPTAFDLTSSLGDEADPDVVAEDPVAPEAFLLPEDSPSEEAGASLAEASTSTATASPLGKSRVGIAVDALFGPLGGDLGLDADVLSAFGKPSKKGGTG